MEGSRLLRGSTIKYFDYGGALYTAGVRTVANFC